jgi:DNA-binding CsgD family transcriptional regulator/tetratricopeptide (TPR) repeat protein
MARVELEPAADELIASGLVVGPSDALLPRHELFAEVTLDRLPEQDRQRLHREVARRTDVPLVKAGHLAAAGEKQTAHRIALDTLAREDRSATRASLLVLAAQTSEPDEDDRLRIEAAEALVAAGAYDEALNLLPELHRGSWERGSWERTAEVLLVRAKALRGRDGPAAARGPLREAMRMARGSGAAIEIRLLLEEVEIRALEWEAPSVPLARRVLSLAEGTRFEPAAHHALGSTLFAAGRRGAIRHLRLAVDSARNTGDVVTMSNAALLLASSLKAAGWWRLSLRVAEAAREEADQHGLHGWATQLTFHRAYTLLDMTGDLETVITLGSDLISDPALPARLLDDAVGTVGLALVEAGRPVEARDVLHRTATRGRSAFRAIAEAELALETEPPTTAIATIDRLMVGLEDDPNTMILRVARAYACLAAGVQRPPDTQDGKLPFTRCYVEELAALHAFSVGDGEEAASRFDLAAAMARRHEIRAAIRCRWMAARSSALAGNLEEACKRLSSLEQETGASGMGRALGRIQGSLRELGVQRSAPRLSGYGPITGRERDVLEGVQAGRRSREIAIELGVSVATVETLIASAMRKLGAATRIQAAQRYAMIQAGSPPGGRGSTEVGTHPG